MTNRYKVTRRRQCVGVLDTHTKRWNSVQSYPGDEIWCGFGFGSDFEGYVRYLNAKHIRTTFSVVPGNDWALPNPDKSPCLTLIAGGAA